MNYFKEMWSEFTFWQKMLYVSAVVTAPIAFFVIFWAFAIACIVAGGSIQTCGV